jgi:ubiquinone/menaquinone biosynthesis C-methylase UbiE
MRFDTRQQPQAFKLANFRDVDASGDAKAYADYLDRFAAASQEMIDTGIDLLQLQQGAAVLDVGCGQGAATPALAARVVPNGRVVGIDLSRELVAEARRRFCGGGLPVEVRVGNAEALDFADASFDAARADRVLLFVDNPRAAVLELARVTRPGGRIVVTESDIGVTVVDSPDVETTREVLTSVGDTFPNAWIGRRLRALFIEAGLAGVDVRCYSVTSTSLAEWSRRLGIDEVMDKAVASGRIRSERAEAWVADLRARDATGRFLACSTFFMVVGIKCEETKRAEGAAN